ncbi:MAG: DUF2855 family protein [Gammaproteobacteria bacterium]|nr:MAG: DUF2855 family protein [Gammaproteobacteria bacterium]
MKEFQTLKSDITKTRIFEVEIDSNDLDNDEIIVQIETFSFTANNISYGVAGDSLGYWQFFPAKENVDEKWGCIPMWGFAKVITSRNKKIQENERLFGYFPPSDYLKLKPAKITEQNFFDSVSHRRDLPIIYNNYLRLDGEIGYEESNDYVRALLFPLHLTAYCLCDALKCENYFDGDQVIILSASSKTAIGLAQGLSEENILPKVLGLTSSRNSEFVEDLGCYDKVLSYDQIENIDFDKNSVLVDMAGNSSIMEKLTNSLGDNLKKCLTVGATHWQKISSSDEVINNVQDSRFEFFFAPGHAQKRAGELGQKLFNTNSNEFLKRRSEDSKKWMQIKEIKGFGELSNNYDAMLNGDVDPKLGLIINLNK